MDKDKKDKKDKIVINTNEKVVQKPIEEPVVADKRNKIGLYVGIGIIIVSGIISGYYLSQSRSSGSKSKMINSEKVVGSTDTKAFPDSAEGVLEEGGIDGEGTHRLIRPGGDSQTVYLTSSVLSLSDFVGKKVKISGETLATDKAGWFMDVGRVEILQ